jgi:hypothetical protein
MFLRIKNNTSNIYLRWPTFGEEEIKLLFFIICLTNYIPEIGTKRNIVYAAYDWKRFSF